ncbi:MAG: SBBP repeat-containing protein [Candidatus Stahlbacteria bacterium]|nr:SBBP repeat-containing protein [Candidatus Stahlbacteria bacterium]
MLLTGSSGDPYTSNWDFMTIKYASSGDSQLVARYNGSANGTDWASAIAVDSAGNIYVTGYSADSVTDCDYATVKYNSSGIEQWVARYNGPVDGYDEGKAIAIDGLGNIYVTGSSYGLATGTDYATVKYNSSGIEQWVARYNGPGNGNDYAYAITVDGSDYIYVTGESEGLGTDYDYTTIKYSCAGVEESSNSKSQIQNPNLEIYPNPFIQSTSIRYHLPAKSKISLNIYDVTGRIVRTLVNEEKETGYYSVGFNAKGLTAGIYFAKLEAVPINRDFGSASTGDYKEVKKLILMR